MNQTQSAQQNQTGAIYTDPTVYDLGVDQEEPGIIKPYIHQFIIKSDSNINVNLCEAPSQKFCIFSFTGTCSDLDRLKQPTLLVGGVCLGHNKRLFNKTFVIMPQIGGGCSITPVPFAPCEGKRTVFLPSLMKPNVHEDDLFRQISDSSTDTSMEECRMLAKFYKALTNREEMIVADQAGAAFKTYMNDLFITYFKSIHNQYTTFGKVAIAAVNTATYIEECNTIFAKVTLPTLPGTLDRNQSRRVYIPLNRFPFIDILLLRGFLIESIINQVGYDANVEPVNGRLMLGSGYGCPNGMSNAAELAGCVNQQYTDDQKSAIDKACLTQTVNLDPLRLFALPANPNEPADLSNFPLEVAAAHSPKITIDISRLKFQM